jgi:polyisoprenyl-phosphate glycosyltransferase
MLTDRDLLSNDAITVVVPVFNDWESLDMMLALLDEALARGGIEANVLVVDDASTIPRAHKDAAPQNSKAIREVNVLQLRRNLGHQRAIAVGLAYVEANTSCRAVVVMDGDGEDDPDDVPKLIEKCRREGYEKLVFAKRLKRSESWLFKLFYLVYRLFYRLLTGYEIRVGNFSVIPYEVLYRVVSVSEIWNHYAVGALKAKVPYVEVPAKRGVRLAGRSRMNFPTLVTHGLSAVSVHGDVVGVRMLVVTCLLMIFAVFGIAVIVVIKITTELAIPGWTSYLSALLFVILMQAVMLSLFFSVLVLNTRNSSSFLPQRDYKHFIMNVRRVYP